MGIYLLIAITLALIFGAGGAFDISRREGFAAILVAFLWPVWAVGCVCFLGFIVSIIAGSFIAYVSNGEA